MADGIIGKLTSLFSKGGTPATSAAAAPAASTGTATPGSRLIRPETGKKREDEYEYNYLKQFTGNPIEVGEPLRHDYNYQAPSYYNPEALINKFPSQDIDRTPKPYVGDEPTVSSSETPVIPDAGALVEGTTTPTTSPVKTANPYTRPETLSEEEYQGLLKRGFTPKNIQDFYAPYDPESGKAYLDQLTAGLKQPSAPDPKKQRNAQTIAGLGDTLRLLGEMAAAGKGAHIGRRATSDYLSPKVAERNAQLLQKYNEDRKGYDDALREAILQARKESRSEYDKNQIRVRRGINDYETLKSKELTAAQRREFDEKKLAQTAEYNKERLAQMGIRDAERVKVQREREARLAKQGVRTGSKEPKAADDKGAKLTKAQESDYFIEGEKLIADGLINADNYPDIIEKIPGKSKYRLKSGSDYRNKLIRIVAELKSEKPEEAATGGETDAPVSESSKRPSIPMHPPEEEEEIDDDDFDSLSPEEIEAAELLKRISQ
jgi:hypothetical protein